MARLTKWKKGTSLAEKKLSARVARLNTSLKKVRSEANTEKIMSTGLAMGGGAIAGALNIFTTPIAGKVSFSAVFGVVLVLYASTGKQKIHSTLGMIGAGALAKGAGDAAEMILEDMQSTDELAEATS